MIFSISKFSSTQDINPSREEMAWADFVTLFSEPVVALCTLANCQLSSCAHKRGPAWSPGMYVNDVGRKENVTAISLLVFDVEHATDAQIHEIRGRIDGYRHLIHATHSDRPNNRCLRIIITLSRPVPRELWGAFWTYMRQMIVPIANTTCSDTGRIYFLPRVQRDAGYFIQVNEGTPLDVDAALVIATAAHHARPVAEGGVAP